MKLYNKTLLIAAIGLSLALSACKEEETPQTPLEAVSGLSASSDIRTVEVEWTPVDGAAQYGVIIANADNVPFDSQVTKETSALFEELDPATQYTIQVIAYPPMGTDRSASPAASVTTMTYPAVSLPAPAIISNRVSTKSAIIEWSSVDDATSYEYKFNLLGDLPSEVKTTTGNKVTLTDLARGVYQFAVRAISSEPEWQPSEWVTKQFTFDGPTSWKKTGTYTSGTTGESWTAVISCISEAEGKFSIAAWHGTPGYYLDFTVNYKGAITINNPLSVSGAYSYVATNAVTTTDPNPGSSSDSNPDSSSNSSSSDSNHDSSTTTILTLGINAAKSSFQGGSTGGELRLFVSAAEGTTFDSFVW